MALPSLVFLRRKMLSNVLIIFLSIAQTILGMEDQNICPKNRSLFEIPGDAVLSGKRSLYRALCICVTVVLCRVVFKFVDENWSLLVCLVFLNINHGPYCNATSSTGLQEVFTASYVVHLLNKYESIPGLSLGK